MSKINDTEDSDFMDDDFSDDVEVEEEAEATAESETEAEPENPKEDPSQSGEAKPDKEDKETYGRKVQKRIDKLVREKRELENNMREMRAKVEAIEAKSTAREFSDFQNQVAYSEQQVKGQLDAAREAYRKAVEEGDIDAQMTTQDRMFELRDQLAEKRRLSELAKEQAQKFQQSAPQPQQQQPASTIPDHLPEGTQSWLKTNRWYADGSDPKAAAYARQLDADLQEEGYSPEDPAMYQELDRRLHAAVPRLAAKRVAQPAAQSPNRPKPQSKVVGSTADGQSTAPQKTASRKLTSSDLETMRKYGFDSNNPDHRKAWIKRNDPL